jgi:hypothetical protein
MTLEYIFPYMPQATVLLHTFPPKPGNNHPKRAAALSQVIAIQSKLYDDVMSNKTSPSARAQLARAFDVLEERKRIMRMIAKPKDVDVAPKSRKPTGFTSPIERAHKSRPTPSPSSQEKSTEKNIAQAVPQPSTQEPPTNPPAEPREDDDAHRPETPTTE